MTCIVSETDGRPRHWASQWWPRHWAPCVAAAERGAILGLALAAAYCFRVVVGVTRLRDVVVINGSATLSVWITTSPAQSLGGGGYIISWVSPPLWCFTLSVAFWLKFRLGRQGNKSHPPALWPRRSRWEVAGTAHPTREGGSKLIHDHVHGGPDSGRHW